MADLAVDANDKQEQTTSEAQALAEILAWSSDCPEWQRDALRRLCTKDGLDEKDLDELTGLCRNRGKGSVALSAEHLPDPRSATTTVILRGIRGVENVNALKEGEHLTFDKTGLTVVYGDNGSGKSGYARLLKKACRARTPKGDKILPNIYAARTGPQKATIEFIANGQNKSEPWSAGKSADPLLSSVSVFDCRTANVHVDEVNDVAYTPFPMKVLERLADACQEIKKRLGAEIRELERQTPVAISNPKCRPETAVGKLIAGLSGNTRGEDIPALATLDKKYKARLAVLKNDLGSDPAKVARQVEALKTRLDESSTIFGRLQNATADAKAKRLVDLFRAYQTARTAATAAAGNLFGNEPLPDVASDVWRVLWEAARAYSEKQAYPGTSFPATGDGSRCVLCQQELDTEAAQRLMRFERFVKDESKRKEEEAATAYRAARDEITNADVSLDDVRKAVVLVRDDLGDEALANTVRRAAVTAKWRLRAILRNHIKDDAAATLPVTELWPTDGISRHAAALSERVTVLRAEDKSDERRKMRAEYDELADREWLAVVQEDVVAEIGRRKERAALDEALKDTATNRITTKSGDVAEQLVTNALRAQFSKEIDRLGVAGLAVELRKDRTSYGVPRFRVSLIRQPDARVGDVLSEGEHRCVALAAFLAELATTEGRSAIVFDDPVSSLDHMHREAVAVRLADEGRHRQIVVLTHDIAFLFLLDQACREKETHVAFRCVTRSDEHAGFCQQDPPARAQPIGSVIDGMQKQIDNEKRLYERGDHAGWEKTVDSLQKRLRSTWERAVEEAVGPVIKRLSNKVETAGLGKVTAVTLDDCNEMRRAYGRCSTLLHSSADVLNKPLPKPDVIQKEITALRNWVDSIKQRQDKIDWLQ